MTPEPYKRDMSLHEGNTYAALLSVSDGATEEADRTILGALHAAAPELTKSNPRVLLDVPQAEAAFETILSNVEDELLRLCAGHDYRRLLHVSRLCSMVPTLMRQDANHEDRRFRMMSADRWILRCAPRSLSRDFMTMVPNDYRLMPVPDALCRDAAKIHVLAHFHQRHVVERARFNFMRLVSARNGLPGPTLRLHEDTTVGWEKIAKELYGSLILFYERGQHASEELAWWGMGRVVADNQLFALSADPNLSISETSPEFFEPSRIGLDAWLEYGRRFGGLFERDTGMPAEHFWAVSRALGIFALESGGRDDGLRHWANLTATMPFRREDLLGGRLARLAAAELRGSGTSASARDLDRSVARYVGLASSSAGTPALGASRMVEGSDSDAAALRNPFYPYMIHGTDRHDYWIVDYLATIPFIRGVINEIEFSGRTTSSDHRDDFLRTSVFDAHLAKELTDVPGYSAVFAAHRDDPTLPNVTFSFDGGAEHREIDVPLRWGEVLIAVQTWTPTVNERTRAGERRAMEMRWNSARDKLRDTDRKYTDYLLRNEEGRKHMRDEGLRYVLPILCGPYAEPLVSLNKDFWLRYPRFGVEGGLKGVTPRVLTPTELVAFLEDAAEQELIAFCEQEGWTL
ncbi:MAG: hypothetical protein H0U02_04465 [Rubrobacter sp.]|nr:hypothetical protein [Rubrobacter sp.]